ncbi:CRISPR-associated protein Csx18 [Scytonema sp. NUACC26]|uniref:CRISPR-associated protein Csx18 n=1 Tax=Scytonema sp. NUACC26 TaxID=3140176 RepID=UPI0034DBFB57
MYVSSRVSTIRNTLVSVFTGGITLIILLIAPLGLAAVIINTLLVTLTTFAVSSVADRVLVWLEPQRHVEVLSSDPRRENIHRRRQSSLNRWWRG